MNLNLQDKLKTSSKLGGIEDSHNYRVKIPFELTLPLHSTDILLNKWNEYCIKAIEMFGLPGEKYTCKFTDSHIEFWFEDEGDAMMFELRCG